MKQQELALIAATEATELAPAWNANNESGTWETQLVYRELADVPVQVVDPLEDLSRSVAQLQDLQARLRFMVREIRSMVKA